MVGPAYDFLENPLGAVRLTFEKAISVDPTPLEGKDWGTAELFRHFLYDESLIAKVPIINQKNLYRIPPKTLVRFRGMIQDMLDNEIYVGVYKDGEVWKTTKYSDVPQFIGESMRDMRLWERRLLHCVSIPGISTWANDSAEEAVERYMDLMSIQREKRSRMVMEGKADEVSFEDSEKLPCAKKLRDEDNLSSEGASSALSSPGMESSSLPVLLEASNDPLSCSVKIYDSPVPDFKINEVYEFVGILNFESNVDHNELDEFDGMPIDSPISKGPCLHCIVHKRLGLKDFVSSLPFSEPKFNIVRDVREALLSHLTSVIGNDGLAGHYMLLHLLSTIHARVDNIAVGKLSLNLSKFDRERVSVFGYSLEVVLKSLLPITERIPLTLEYLNTASLSPKKDYQLGRLLPGALQLVEGSHLLIDETRLDTGTLNSVGVENVRSLKYLVESQKVEYDFTYYKIEMPADVQVLILSDGKSNIFPADVVLPFHPSCEFSLHLPVTEETWNAWRWYLASTRSMPHSIDPGMKEVVEKDLVAARQADRSLNCEDLSRWMTMGRLIAASYGDTNLKMEHWQLVKEMERLRTERLR